MGAGHCGSTILDLILGSHSQAFSLGEFRSLSQSIKGKTFCEAICGICGDACSFWNQSASLPILNSYFCWGANSNHIIKRLYWHFGSFRCNMYDWLFHWSGANILIDSSKTVGWIRRQLRPFWFWRDITPFLIYIHRDGRAVVNSFLRKYPQQGITHLTEKWVKTTMAMENFFNAFPQDQRLKLSYEELATTPENTINAVCRVLRLSFEPAMLLYWQHQHHVVQGNSGTRSLILKYREQFNGGNSSLLPAMLQTNQIYYEQLGLAIKLDLRWQDELSQNDLKIFDSIAGKLNKKYAFEPKVS